MYRNRQSKMYPNVNNHCLEVFVLTLQLFCKVEIIFQKGVFEKVGPALQLYLTILSCLEARSEVAHDGVSLNLSKQVNRNIMHQMCREFQSKLHQCRHDIYELRLKQLRSLTSPLNPLRMLCSLSIPFSTAGITAYDSSRGHGDIDL